MKRSVAALVSGAIVCGWWWLSELPRNSNLAFAQRPQWGIASNSTATQAQTATPTQTATTAAPTQGSKRLKIQFEIAKVGDLKVRDGQQVTSGQLIAEHRQTERKTLGLELDRVNLSIEKLKLAPQVGQVPPAKVGDLKGGNLSANFATEKAEIAAAQTKIRDIQRKYQLAKKSIDTPLAEAARVRALGVAAKQIEGNIARQQQKIDALATMEEIDKPISDHEKTKLDKLKQSLIEAQTKIDEAKAIEGTATAARSSKLEEIRLEFTTAQRELAVAKAKLSAAIDKHQQQQVDRSIEASDREDRVYRTELERVKLAQSNALQTHDRDYNLAQLQLKKTQLEKQMAAIAGITAPYAGTIRRVKLLSQQGGLLKYEVVLMYAQIAKSTPTNAPKWQSE
jgi:hypothetical protein